MFGYEHDAVIFRLDHAPVRAECDKINYGIDLG